MLEYRDVVLDTLTPSSLCSKCDTDAKYRCLTCRESLCKECFEEHGTPEHKVKPLNEVYASIRRSNPQTSQKETIFCREHSEWMKYYCIPCSVLICEECLRLSHKFHEYTDPDDAGKLFKRQVRRQLDESQTIVENLRDVCRKHGDHLEKIHMTEEESLEKLRQMRDQVMEEVRSSYSKAEDKIRGIFADARSKSNVASEATVQHIGKLTDAIEFVDGVRERATGDEILLLKGVILQRLDALRYTEDTSQVPNEQDIPVIDVALKKPTIDMFSVTKNFVEPSITRNTKPFVRNRPVKDDRSKDEARKQSVQNCKKLLDLKSCRISDVCWINSSQVALADSGSDKLVVYGTNGQRLWEKPAEGIRNVAVVADVVVCDSVDAVYPFNKSTNFNRIYVSTKSGPFPIAKSRTCNKIYAGGINPNQIKIYYKNGKKDSVCQLKRSFVPSHMTLDSKHNLIAIESVTKLVWNILTNGSIESFYKPQKEMRHWEPSGICVDPGDYVYITNAADDTLWQFSRKGECLLVLNLSFRRPTGLSINADRCFISADINGAVWSFSVPR